MKMNYVSLCAIGVCTCVCRPAMGSDKASVDIMKHVGPDFSDICLESRWIRSIFSKGLRVLTVDFTKGLKTAIRQRICRPGWTA